MSSDEYEDWAPLILVGELRLIECEGGFSAPQFSLLVAAHDISLDREVLAWRYGSPEHPSSRRGGLPTDVTTIGRVRITIERIE